MYRHNRIVVWAAIAIVATSLGACGSSSKSTTAKPSTSTTAKPRRGFAAGATQPVPYTSRLNGVACPSATTCDAVGQRDVSGTLFGVHSTVNGSAQGQSVPDTASLFGVGCASATTCYAVGRNRAFVGVVVPITNGSFGAPQVVAGTTALDGVACANATTCYAVGTYNAQGMVVPITNGTIGAPYGIGAISLSGVACPNETRTTAPKGVGSPESGPQGPTPEIHPPTPPPPPPYTICYAVGKYENHGQVVTITNGKFSFTPWVAGTSTLSGVACASFTTCYAVGQKNAGPEGLVVPITNGIPGAAHVVAGTWGLSGVACPSATTCKAVGFIPSQYGDGAAVPITDGTIGAAQTVAGTQSLSGVACPSATTCYAVGGARNGQGVVGPT